MKLHQRTIKTAAMFSILLFLVLSITMTLSTAFAVLLFRIGFLDSQHLLRGLFAVRFSSESSLRCSSVAYPSIADKGVLNSWDTFSIRGLFVTPTVSIVIGTILFRLIGKRPLELILEISKATQEVAKGNCRMENIAAVFIVR